MKKTITLLIAIFSINLAFSQEYDVINHDFDGFHPNPFSFYFAEEGDGSIWVLQSGSFFGDVISRYSEGEWESIEFDACNNCVFRLIADNEGVIHAVTNQALFAYENNEWVIKSDDIFRPANVDYDSKGNLWFTHTGNLMNLAYRTPEGEVVRFDLIDGVIDELTVANDDTVWFINNEQIVNVKNGLFNFFDLSVDNLVVDGNNVAWFKNFNGTLGKIDGTEITEDLFADVAGNFSVLSIGVDRKNDLLYLGRQGFNIEDGLVMIDLITENTVIIPANELFSEESVQIENIFVSRKGEVWVGNRSYSTVAQVIPDVVASTTDLSSTFRLYPNPASEFIVIENQNGNNSYLGIYNSLGKLVDRRNLIIGQNQIDVSNLENGMYTIGNDEIGYQRLLIVK